MRSREWCGQGLLIRVAQPLAFGEGIGGSCGRQLQQKSLTGSKAKSARVVGKTRE